MNMDLPLYMMVVAPKKEAQPPRLPTHHYDSAIEDPGSRWFGEVAKRLAMNGDL